MTLAELFDPPVFDQYDVQDAIDAYRARLVTAYVTSGDPFEQIALYAEAVEYDRAYPGEPALADELYGAQGEVA